MSHFQYSVRYNSWQGLYINFIWKLFVSNRSAFFLFCGDRRADVKKVNPTFTVGDIAKSLGKMWADATPDIKSKYEALAKTAKEKYTEVCTELSLPCQY